MKKSNLNEIKKKELTVINGGGIPIPSGIWTIGERIKEAERMSAELRSIR